MRVPRPPGNIQSSKRLSAQLRRYFANSACAASAHMARSPPHTQVSGRCIAHPGGESTQMDIGLGHTATTLESRFTELDTPILLSGIQALVRVLLEQARLDRAARPEHRRSDLRLSRLTAGRARPRGLAPPENARRPEHPVPAGRQRRPRRDHAVRHAAARCVSRQACRWRVRHVVRQGSRRRSRRRRAALRQFHRHREARRRAGGGRATTTARTPRHIRTRPSTSSRASSSRC